MKKTMKTTALLLLVLVAMLVCIAGCGNDFREEKDARIAELKTYAQADYYDEQWLAIENARNKAIEEINALETKEAIEAYDVAAVNAYMDSVKTKAQIDEENRVKELNEAKEEAVRALNTYDEENYYAEQWAELSKLYSDTIDAIKAAETLAELEAIDIQAVNAAMAVIMTKSQLDALKPTITTTIEDGKTYGSVKLTFDVYAKDAKGNKIASKVTNNGEDVGVNWDDAEKTSYTIDFSEYENNIVISAEADGYKTELELKVYFVKAAPTFTFSMDAFTIGCGYLVEPVLVTLDDATVAAIEDFFDYEEGYLEDNLRASHVMIYELSLYGYTVSYTGRVDSGFYMSSVKGFYHENKVPANLLAALEENGFSVDDEPYDNEELGEFDYTYGSGWMYSVDGSVPNVGFADHYVQDGEVMRISFTLAYGADIFGSSFFGAGYFPNVMNERDSLCNAIALANKANKKDSEAYKNAMNAMATFGLEKQDLTDIEKALRDVLAA